MSKTRFYGIWVGMNDRCENERNDPKNQKSYAEKGVTVFERWKTFENFLEDMYASYLGHVALHGEKRTTLDRENNDGNYEPGNVRWATQAMQNRNYRRNIWLEFNGKRMVLKDWSEEVKISQTVLKARLNRGWSVEKTLTFPLRPMRPFVHWTKKRKK